MKNREKTIKSIEKMQDVKKGKIDLELAKYQIMSKLKIHSFEQMSTL